MKLVIGIVRPEKANDVLEALYRAEVRGLSVSRVQGHGGEHAYLTILREAFDWTGQGEALGLYFGATSGDVFGSGDAGASWSTVATRLPPVLSVTAR